MTFWPNETQQFLLNATFQKGEAVSNSWEKWRELTTINHLDPGSYRMIPQLYFNLKAHGIEDLDLNKMKGIYRYTWAKNQHLFLSLKPALLALQEAGIEMLLLKGSALVLEHYRDFGLRPMDDFDLLVPEAKAIHAIEILEKHDWHRKFLRVQIKKYTPTFLRVHHGLALLDNELGECDLHWRVYDGFERDLWQHATPFDWEGIHFLIPSPTDLLFHVCVHGAAYNIVPTFRWVGDALVTMKSPIDWPRLSRLAAKHKSTLPLQETLDYLHTHFQQPHSLKASPITPEERALYALKSSPQLSPHTWKENIHHLWTHHPHALTFPTFLTKLWGLNSVLELPWHLLKIHHRFFSHK